MISVSEMAQRPRQDLAGGRLQADQRPSWGDSEGADSKGVTPGPSSQANGGWAVRLQSAGHEKGMGSFPGLLGPQGDEGTEAGRLRDQ